MRKLMILAAMALVLAIALPAARWAYAGNGATPKVTGGAEAQAGGVTFSMAVNAIELADGTYKGKIQYSRDAQPGTLALKFHANVECSMVFDGMEATAAGPITIIQDNSSGQITPTENWACAAVKEGDPDTLRIQVLTSAEALACCVTDPDSFPGTVVDGNFTIREVPAP